MSAHTHINGVYGILAAIIGAFFTVYFALHLKEDAVENKTPIHKQQVNKPPVTMNSRAAPDSKATAIKKPAPVNGNIARSGVITTPIQPVIPANNTIDISGMWNFNAAVLRGKDTTGTIFKYTTEYQSFVEIAQTGQSINGTYSGPPGIICGAGNFSGHLKTAQGTTRIEWLMNCENECRGEQRIFNGTYDNKSKTIIGEIKPVKTPVKNGCWLGYERLSGLKSG